MADQKYLFVGNPGVGKSTLMNCLIGDAVFRSGVSAMVGLTYELNEKVTDKGTFLDTPGLEDVRMREAAAKAITQALKKGGKYKVFFVVTTESGRLRPADLACMNLILGSCTDIKHYNIIFNKLTKQVVKKLSDKNGIINQILADVESTNEMRYMLLQRHDDLEDEDDTFAEMPLLEDFVYNTAKGMDIRPENVQDIEIKKWDQQVEMLEAVLKQLKEDKAADLVKFQEIMAANNQAHEQGMTMMQSALKSALDRPPQVIRESAPPCCIS